jgi:hypothetical protein
MLVFVLAVFSSSWWQACTSYMYTNIAKGARPMKYARL